MPARSDNPTVHRPDATRDNSRGALYMVICMAGFSLNDALIKSVSGDLGLFQAVFLRGVFATLLMGLLVTRSKQWINPATISTPDRKMLALRLVGEVGGTICFLTAIFNMPLANASAILQFVPLAVTLAAALFLSEQVGWRRYLAITAGFIGVLIIVRPGASQFNEYSLWAIGACGFLVLRDLCTRGLSAALPARFIAWVTAAIITMLGAAVSLFNTWQPVSISALLVLAIAACFVLTGYLFGVMAMQTGEVSAIAPFRYSILVWSILLGIIFFEEWPDQYTLLGSAILVLAGLYTLHRERQLGREARRIRESRIADRTPPDDSSAG